MRLKVCVNVRAKTCICMFVCTCHGSVIFSRLFDIVLVRQGIAKTHRTNLHENSFRLPYWTDSVLDQMDELAIYGMKMVTNTKQLARLKAGSLIKEIFDRFTMKEDSTLSPNRSIWIYSAHAETIINLLNALDLFEVIKHYNLFSYHSTWFTRYL